MPYEANSQTVIVHPLLGSDAFSSWTQLPDGERIITSNEFYSKPYQRDLVIACKERLLIAPRLFISLENKGELPHLSYEFIDLSFDSLL